MAPNQARPPMTAKPRRETQTCAPVPREECCDESA
jgi:hypothetical protein